jgi:hypothetical protein
VAYGGGRHLHAVGRGDSHGFTGDGWGAHIEGAAGEIAVARLMGWDDWTPTIDTYQSERDLPLGIEVTTRRRDDYELIVRPRMAIESNHVLVTGVAGLLGARLAAQPAPAAPSGGTTPGRAPGAWFGRPRRSTRWTYAAALRGHRCRPDPGRRPSSPGAVRVGLPPRSHPSTSGEIVTNPFAPLSSGGSWLKPAERNGHLVIIANAQFVGRKYDEMRKAEVDVVKFDLADLSQPARAG